MGDEAERLRGLILSFVASFTLADHIGDVSNDVEKLLREIGFDEAWYSQEELADKLADMGVKTLYGTELD